MTANHPMLQRVIPIDERNGAEGDGQGHLPGVYPVTGSPAVWIREWDQGRDSIERGTGRGIEIQHRSDSRPVLLSNLVNEIQLTILRCLRIIIIE